MERITNYLSRILNRPINLDEKCLVILDEIAKTPGRGASFDDLYHATVPTNGIELEKRISKMKDARLLVKDEDDDYFSRMTVIGKYVECKLNGKPFINWLGYTADETDSVVFLERHDFATDNFLKIGIH